MTIRSVFIAFLCIFSCTCVAYTIPQCGSDGILEISDTTAEVTVSCTGIWNDYVYLSFTRSDGTTKRIVSCSTKKCLIDPNFRVVREEDVIHVIKKENVQSRDTLAGTLKCGRLGYVSPVASCQLRVVSYTIPQCGSDGILEISDTTAEVTVSCTGIWNYPVYLSITRSDGTTKTIVSCPTKPCYIDPDFRVTWKDGAMHVVKKGNVQSRDTLAGTLKCGRRYSFASCRLRVMSYTIPHCDSDGILEISDTTAEVTVSCTGIGDDPVFLSITRSDGTTKTIGSCPTKYCYADPNFRVTWKDDAVHAVKIRNVQSRDTLAGTLECGSQYFFATCRLRVVYDAEEVKNCTTEVNEDWTVSGSCQVNKMFASDGNYSCTWWRIPQAGQPSIFPGQMEVTSTFTENGQTYDRGLCSFAGHAMPTTAGHYGYSATIDPGHGYSTGAGINIKPPEGDPDISHCPTQLVEGDTLNCTCHVSSSSPPAVVSWSSPPEISSSLVIHSVTRSQDGSAFTCHQYWGGYSTSFGQEAKYTLHVNSPSTAPSVTTSPVTEKGVDKETLAPSTAPWVTTSPVTERGVHEKTLAPSTAPWVTTSPVTERGVHEKTLAPSTVPSVTTSPVTEKGVHEKTLAPNPTSSLETSSVPVNGAGGENLGATKHPKEDNGNNDNNSDDDGIPVAFIVGGAAGVLFLIIIVAVVIVCCKKRKAKSAHLGNIERRSQEDDELVEHINNFYVSADEIDSLQPASAATAQQPPPERKPISARPGENETSLNLSPVSPQLHQASASNAPSDNLVVDVGLYSTIDDCKVEEAAGNSETINKPTAHETEEVLSENYSAVDRSRKTQRKKERKEKRTRQTSQVASSAGAGATQQHSDGQGDGTAGASAGDLYSVVQKQKRSSKNSVNQPTPGPAEPTVPPSLQHTGKEEKPETAGDEYGRLTFHRRPSTELPGNLDTVYSHIGAP